MRGRIHVCVGAIALASVGIAGHARGQTCDRVLGVAGEGVSWSNSSGHSTAPEANTAYVLDTNVGPRLIVGGLFDRAGDAAASNIAMWDGIAWQAIGVGTSGRVKGLGGAGSYLYIGGDFTSAGGVANSAALARWNGSIWEAGIPSLNGGSPWPSGAAVNGIASAGSRVCIWGRLAGQIATDYYSYENTYYVNSSGIDGSLGCNTGLFSVFYCPPGTIQAVDPTVEALCLCGNGNVYPPSSSAMAWPSDNLITGYEWIDVPGGTGFTSTCARTVNGAHWIGGRSSGGTPVLYKTVRNVMTGLITGLTPVTPVLPSGGQGSVTAMVQRGTGGSGAAVAVGLVNGGSGATTSLVYEYVSGQNPSIMGTAVFNGRINELVEFNGSVVAVGKFTQVGLKTCRNVARYDQGSGVWVPLVSAGIDVAPTVLANYGSELWAGGAFGTIAGAFIPNLAKQVNGVWQPVTVPPPSQPVTLIRFFSPNPQSSVGAGMVVGGDFTAVGQTQALHIAMLTFSGASGGGGSPIVNVAPLGLGLNAAPRAMMNVNVTFVHDDLIVGGDFTLAGGAANNHVARWTGANGWQSMSTGMNGNVLALAQYNGQIIAGGAFTMASGLTESRIAAWNASGGFWAPMGVGFDNTVRCLAVYNGQLYAGGDFTASGATALGGLARWDSGAGAWVSPGVGFNGSINAMRVLDSDLLLGGAFVDSFPGPVHLNRLGLFNGATVRPIGQGVENTVVSLAQVDADFYASSLAAPFVFRATPAVTPTVEAFAVGTPCLENMNIFQASATNCAGGQFHWRRNNLTLSDGVVTAAGGIVIGANSAQMFFFPADASDGGTFDCQVVCPCGTTISDPIMVGWSSPPKILVQPIGGPFCIGGTQQLAIIADGTPPLQYDWYKDGNFVQTTTSPMLSRADQTAADAGVYSCRVSNACGSVLSQSVQRSPVAPPGIVTQPTARSLCAGQSASFTVTASNAAGAGYRWYRNNFALSDHAAGPGVGSVSGSGTPTLGLAQIATGDAGYYTCHVTTGCVAISDAALLSVAAGACCPADFNASGTLTPQDIFDFLNAWFSGSLSADFNHMNGLTPQDIFDFLNAWFVGC